MGWFSLGKEEAVSSILTGSTAADWFDAQTYKGLSQGTTRANIRARGKSVAFVQRMFAASIKPSKYCRRILGACGQLVAQPAQHPVDQS
jgi:hypothetical protein